MINDLRVTKTANFYSLRRSLTNHAIDDLFRKVRAAQPSASQNLFHHRRESLNGVVWSAICFMYEREPSFFDTDTTVRERVCGFMLIVEYNQHLAVFKSRIDIPTAFARKNLGRVPAERVDGAIARSDAVFERIRLRNMSLSRLAMRSKTLEAGDLSNAVGPAGSSRYVTQGYTVRAGVEHYSTTPSTGRIAQRSDRIKYDLLIEYARTVIDELASGTGVPSSFIRNFARAIDLDSIEGKAHPSAISMDVAHLIDALYDNPQIRLVRDLDGSYVQLQKTEIDPLLDELNTVFKLQETDGTVDIINPGSGEKTGWISINKSRIALRALELPLIATVEVERLNYPVGDDPDRMTLRTYLDKNDAFILLFDQISLAYIDGALFRDESFTSGGGNFLRYIRTESALSNVVDEKVTFTPAHIEFDDNSTFGTIVRKVAIDDELLICDDLGDEWADFIGLDTRSNPIRITFYHAKHGDLSLGASPFHVSVSQAIKNLGRMSLETTTVSRKFAGWRARYRNDGADTAIERVVRGDFNQLEHYFEQARGAPDAIRRVCIVTSSLSRKAVANALDEIAKGNAPDPYFVQLYWLLLSFFSACTEVGASGSVICQE